MKTITVVCVDCGKERNIRDRDDQPPALRCRSCNMRRMAGSRGGELSYTWRGGQIKRGRYKRIKLFIEDFFFGMTHCDGYILEHRLVMAKSLGRCLGVTEVVHHRNGVKHDNRRDNLELLTFTKHNSITNLGRRIKPI